MKPQESTLESTTGQPRLRSGGSSRHRKDLSLTSRLPRAALNIWIVLGIGALVLWLAASKPLPAAAAAVPENSWFVDMNRFAASAHASFSCEECHGTMLEDGGRHPDPQHPQFLRQQASRSYDYERCGKCHRLSHERYKKGAHAKALEKEKKAEQEGQANPNPQKESLMAPTCGECHSSHYDVSGRSRVALGKRQVEVCGSCHPRYTESYMKNIHGRTGVDLGNEQSAYCTDCHGAHSVASLAKGEEALPVCLRCHPQAGPEFANVVIHELASVTEPPEEPAPKDAATLWIQRVRIAAIAVVVLSLVFFFGHSALWLLRELHEKLRKH